MSSGIGKKITRDEQMLVDASRMWNTAKRLIRFTDHNIDHMVKHESGRMLRMAFKFWVMAKLGYAKRG